MAYSVTVMFLYMLTGTISWPEWQSSRSQATTKPVSRLQYGGHCECLCYLLFDHNDYCHCFCLSIVMVQVCLNAINVVLLVITLDYTRKLVLDVFTFTCQYTLHKLYY